ncbi:conserved hypothetical protein [Thiomonas sp. X19]|uniref:hypothetical protein n=1 Tax=Thiomonas sp. X19 TaxID=1050370 RepID=UPI000B7227A1|nr:hypothetical protein [Thiomonas sp. X19]SCC94913.1 conserved hypothetical protein [Thiomonas sp. X19]
MLGLIPVMSTGGYAFVPDVTHYSAVSNEATQVIESLRMIDYAQQGSQMLSGRLAEATSALYAAVNESEVDDEQAAVPLGAIQNARSTLRALPTALPLPEIGIDPDGAISLDWMPTRSRMFSISVSDSDRLAYAWLNGTERGHGVVRLVAGQLPGPMLLQLMEIAGDAAASLRAA